MSRNNTKDIASRIKKYMADNGIKQTFIAGAVEESDSQMSAYLNGNLRMPLDVYMNVCEVLKVSADYFRDKGDAA